MAEPTTPEQLFRDYRDRGDPTALAAVFDQTAPRLLLLAAHVTPDGSAAEDLLQETFLAAIEAAPRWDDTRPLLPWLGGILRHKAMHLNRQRRRAAAASIEDADPAAADAGPGDATADGELFERIQEALGGMPAPYREVLVLRLVHGIEPTAIAHTLGRAPGTVRTQLKRGLELLRGALPASLASGLALLLLPGRGLAAVRTAVLGASPVAASAAGTAAVGAAARLGWLWILAVASVLVATGWWWSRSATSPLPNSTDAPLPATAMQHRADDAGVLAETGDPAQERTPVPVANTEPGPTTLRGRAVAARDGLPLGGGQVEVRYGRGRFMTDAPEFRTWPEPHSQPIAADGTFAIAVAAAPARRVILAVSSPGHVGVETEWISLQNDLDVALGDIPLHAGCELRARVFDPAGTPVVGLEISISRESGGFDPGESPFYMLSSFDRTSDVDGQLPPRMLPASCTYAIDSPSSRSGYRVLRPTSLTIDTAPILVLDIVVEGVGRAAVAESLRGRVVDASGRPVAGVPLQVHPSMPDLGWATSAADGTFAMELYGVRPETELCIPWQQLRYRLLEPERIYTRGAGEVEVKVAVLPHFEVALDVVDARDGRPVEAYGVRHGIDVWSGDDPMRIPDETIYFPARAEARPDGRALLPGLAPGNYRVSVFPADPELAPARLVPFVVADDGTAPVRIELHPHVPLQVRVLDTDGRPVADAEVSLVHEQGCEGDVVSLFSIEELARGVGGGLRTAALLQKRTTGADGTVVLRAPAAESRLSLRVAGPRCTSIRQPLPVLPASGGTHEVRVARAARIVGRLEPRELLAAIGPSPSAIRDAAIVRPENSELLYSCPELWVRDMRGKVVARGRVLPDATFRIDSVPPGDHQLWLGIEWQMNPGHVSSEDLLVADVPALRADEEREVIASARAAAPSQVRGHVRVDGAVWTRGEAGLRQAHAERARYFTLSLDPRGDFVRVVRADTYLPYVEWQEDGQSKRLWADDRITLVAGEQQCTLAFERRALALEVHTADGSAASGLQLLVTAVDYPEIDPITTAATDADGRVRLDPAPPGQLTIAWRSGDQWVELCRANAVRGAAPVWCTLSR